MNRQPTVLGWVMVAAVILLVLLVGWPRYRVWQRELAGKAMLREATWSRQVAVEEARAKKEAAVMLAAAEVERAKGLAQANTIVIQSLGTPEAYLRWLWVQGIDSANVFYVPTEAALPVLEAGRALTP